MLVYRRVHDFNSNGSIWVEGVLLYCFDCLTLPRSLQPSPPSPVSPSIFIALKKGVRKNDEAVKELEKKAAEDVILLEGGGSDRWVMKREDGILLKEEKEKEERRKNDESVAVLEEEEEEEECPSKCLGHARSWDMPF